MGRTQSRMRSRRWPYGAWLISLLALCLAIGGCNGYGLHGEGAVTTEPRTVDTFSAIEVSNGIRLVAAVGQPLAVEIRAQPNLLPLITTAVTNGTLRISSSQPYSTSEGVEADVSVPTLSAVTLSGGSNGQVSGIAGTDLAVTLSGGSRLTGTGTASTLTVNVQGGSRAELGQLPASNVAVDLSGGSVVIVQASGEVNGSASGGASLTVSGGATVNVQASGGASVVKQ